jgi:tetratricopeptide (TPR) repeat protein
VGHSVGGIEALLFGMRNGNVAAVIGLDGTYGFKDSTRVLTDVYCFAPDNMRAAILDLRRAEGEQQAALDLSPLQSLQYSDRTVVTLKKMHHSDFTSFAMVANRFHTPITSTDPRNGWDRGTAQVGYQSVCQIVLKFLDGKLKNDHPAIADLPAMVASIDDASLKQMTAAHVPPSPEELIELVDQLGLPATRELLNRLRGDQSLATFLDQQLLNSFGYDLLGQRRPKAALNVFEISAWSNPNSANAQDSLADGYFAVGDKEHAQIALGRALDLAPSDSSIEAGSKESFIKDVSARLKYTQ